MEIAEDAFEYRLERICKDCDDHEDRIRKIEANDKAYEKLYATADKLNVKMEAIESKLDVRINVIEKWMDARVLTISEERSHKVEEKHDIYSIIALCISIGTFIVLLVTKVI